jgi:ABC-type lipoprotein export system ATPase subunit
MDDTVRVATCFPFLSAASRGGRRLDDDSLTKLRRSHIGFIFQFFNLLPMLTVGDRQPLRHGQHADPVVFERTRELGMLRAVGMTGARCGAWSARRA